MKAIIPAAGLGTRFLPATKAQPKEMLPVLERPAIQYVVEEALAANANEVVIVSNASKRAIEEHFSPNKTLAEHLAQAGKTAFAAAVEHAGSLPVTFAEQTEPLGLGHAIRCAATAVGDEPFYVLLGDVLVPDNALLPRMLEVSQHNGGASVIAVMRVPHEDVSRFGIIDAVPVEGNPLVGHPELPVSTATSSSCHFEMSAAAGEAIEKPSVATTVWEVKALVEKPPVDEAPSDLAIFGRYLLTPAVMRILEHTAPGAGGEIQLTDALVELLATEKMFAIEVSPDEGFDTGTIASWLETNIRLAQRNAQLAPAICAAVG
ncbi:MAG: NTP transferase domain-containing protein [Coriobacteriales bacterium]|nr:NTP transferase domain-containing protein [Coriobacteriales bacterium]